MAQGKITNTVVEKIQPEAADVYLWDTELKGFGVKVTPAGKRVYLVQYRMGGRKGRTRRVTIGDHNVLKAPRAREEAVKLLSQVKTDVDPAEERAKKKATETLGEVLERFLVEHADAKLKPRTAEEYRRTIRLHVIPALGRRQLKDIARADISRFHHAMRDTPRHANFTLAVLSKFFNWCERHGFRPENSNPCHHIDKYRENRRERYLNDEELGRLGKALRELELAEGEDAYVIAAIRLLVFTGARLNEILTLKWEYVDFERMALTLPDSKTGFKVIQLTAPALQTLQGVQRQEGNPFVICGARAGEHLVNLQKPWRRIRKLAGLDDIRIHDFRHTFASHGVIGGASLPIVGKLLGHSQMQTTERYAHLSNDPLKQASNAIAGRIAGAMSGGEAAEVVGLADYRAGKK